MTFIGLMAPEGTPDEVITLLNREINQILSDPAEREALEKQGMLVAGGEPADFEAKIKADYQSRGKILGELNLAAE